MILNYHISYTTSNVAQMKMHQSSTYTMNAPLGIMLVNYSRLCIFTKNNTQIVQSQISTLYSVFYIKQDFFLIASHVIFPFLAFTASFANYLAGAALGGPELTNFSSYFDLDLRFCCYPRSTTFCICQLVLTIIEYWNATFTCLQQSTVSSEKKTMFCMNNIMTKQRR